MHSKFIFQFACGWSLLHSLIPDIKQINLTHPENTFNFEELSAVYFLGQKYIFLRGNILLRSLIRLG